MFREMNKILKTTGDRWRFIALIILRSPVSIAMTFVNAIFLQQAFNAVTENNNSRLIAICFIFGIAGFCIFLYNGMIWSIYAAPQSIKMEGKLRVKLFKKISSLSCKRLESLEQGDWLTRLNVDVQMPYSESWSHMVSAIVNIIISSLILLNMNPSVYGWIILFVAPHIIISQLLIARVMSELNKNSLEATAINANDFTALINYADIAIQYNGYEYFIKRFEKSSMELVRTNMKMLKRNALSSGILPLFGLSGYLVLLIVSSGWIADGYFTFGDLSAAFQLRGGVLLGSLSLINCMISIQANLAGVRRLNETMEENAEVKIDG